MKKYLILFVFFVVNQMMSQEISVDLPVLSPQSPEAYQLAKYGEVNVNESTGVISPSIPLYTYKSGGVSIPITLNYSGNGVKVAQETSWTGINWNLNAGGVITRQVRDLPDESQGVTKKYYTYGELGGLTGSWDYNTTTTPWYMELESIGESSSVDSEADIFNYNFLGYSGSFYLDENLDAHLIKYDVELDIDFQKDSGYTNKSVIVIKTPEGDTYFFGGPDASESSRSWANNGAGSTMGIDFAQNAFYLYLISPYNGGSTTFTYQELNLSGSSHKIDTQENLSKYVYSEGSCGTLSGTTYTYSDRDVFLEIETKVFLKKIESSFNDSYIDFSFSSLGTRKRKLNYVYVKDASDDILKKFKLNYSTYSTETSNNDNRFFLNQVDFHDKNLNKVYDYKLEYNSSGSLPSKWSYARDDNGYFNGQTTNTTLLPVHPSFTGSISLANREVDTNKIKYGSLSKITYPTGGYTTFEYESPIKGFSLGSDLNSMVVYHNDPTRNGESDYEDQLWYEDDGLYHLEAGQTVDVNLLLTTVGDLTHQNSISVSTHHSGTTQQVYNLPIGNSQNNTKNYNENFTINILQTGDYYFILNLNLHSSAVNDTGLEIDAIAGIEIPNQIPIPEYYPSLRIKSINTYESSTASPLVKRYYYNKKESITEELNYLVSDISYTYESKVRRVCLTSNVGFDYFNNLTTSALNNVYGEVSGKILYPYVTVSYGGANFEQGGKESRFYTFRENTPLPYFEGDIYSTYGSNLSFANSTLLEETYFTYNNSTSQFSVQKETNYKYSVLPTTHVINNVKPFKYVSGTIGIPDIRDFNFGLYDTSSRKYALTKISTTEILDDLNDTITTVEDITYNTYMGQPSKIIKNDSRGIESENRFYYPNDVIANNEGLSGPEAVLISALDDHHRIFQPYMIKEYYDGVLVESRQTIFSDEWYANKIWPKTVKTKKDSLDTYQERIEFINYNFYGMLEELSQEKGAITQYRYNSKQQVIMQMVNHDPSFTIDDGLPTSTPCYYQVLYPNAMVTTYEYDPDTNLLLSVTSPNCVTVYYEYDDFGRLEFVKDDDNNILSNTNYQYKQ